DFFVVPAGDGFLLELAKAKADNLVQRLGFYKLRAQVDIANDPSFAVAATWGALPRLPDGAFSYADSRLPARGHRILLPAGTSRGDLGWTLAAEDQYHARRIELGVPEGGRDYAFGDTFPHEALFDQLAGVDFNKGCFVGQEVVSRMEHRGTARTRIVRVVLDDGAAEAGTAVLAADKSVGVMGSSAAGHGLALLRLDRAADAFDAGIPLIAGGIPIRLADPDDLKLLPKKTVA
ncbi:MAG: CAF17-like 4Fe-4S cluster assembly/insertion protein YgfZ, partial [Nitrobacter sp.]